MLAETIAGLKPSPIVEIFDQALRLRAEGRDLIDLSVGEPDFDTPPHIREAGVRAIETGATRYTATDGTGDLKAAIIRKFRRDNQLAFSPPEIVISAGAKPLLAVAMQAVLNPGDEVIMTTPCWASHPGMVELCAGVPVLVETGIGDGFKLSPERLAAVLTPRTRMLVLCSPSNPTGAVYSAQELVALADILRMHPDVLVLSDDLYEHIVFDGNRFATLAAVAPDLGNRIFTVNGVSKAYAMTGWRIGYGGGPEWWMDGIRAIFSQSNGGPCSISQAAAVAALDGPQDLLVEWRKTYQDRRDAALEGVAGIEGLEALRPQGAFYLMPHCGALIGCRRPDGGRIETSTDLASWFLDSGVVVVPGRGFHCGPYFRMSVAASEPAIRQGLERMADACARLERE